MDRHAAKNTSHLGPVAVEGGTVWWEEVRPGANGRARIMRRTPAGATSELFAEELAGSAIRSGAWLPVSTDTVVAASEQGSQLYLLRRGTPPQPLTPDRPHAGVDRYSDLVRGPTETEIWCVRESRRGERTERSIVAVPLDGTRRVHALITTTACVSTPRPSPDGRLLAWLSWQAPQMPWDGAQLWVGRITASAVTDAWIVLGGQAESVFQPEWAGADSLYVVSDRSRWWNLYQVWLDGTLRPLCLLPEEFGWPQWRTGLADLRSPV